MFRTIQDNALLWIWFWAKGLPWKSTKGGKQGRVEVASRYNCVLEDDWPDEQMGEGHIEEGSRVSKEKTGEGG